MVDRDDTPDLPAERLEEVEEFARGLVHGGFTSLEDAVDDVGDYFEEDDGVTGAVARSVVERVWRERAEEQAGWPATTDVDRLLAAFDALEGDGIVARADFTCCQTCGHAEIGDEVDPGVGDARGYVFFHRQDTEAAVADGGVYLAFGSFGEVADHAAADEAVAREVVTALTSAGLPVEWNGSVRTRIKVGPMAWRKRLPVG
ncbi:DUF6891 domain-containing protein [Saccharothrix yanglingensis]|uniref:DUF6891 domain-containing protein n=1 Tax=Saccharothrix yanglingensis TaxID=659496 RepID=A0ABU0WUY2_9PSEU|nr:hypothetical protein [Saccharothrix yanglingensis]MDQ2583187.1 hypothetical protein [Saccharothrix yanglingensis]